MRTTPAEAIALAARTIRVLSVDAVLRASSGHVGLPLGCAELATVLFAEFLRHDPAAPDWPDRDRFVLSAGHGSMLLYAVLHLSGYAISLDDLRQFRQLGSITPGHPEHGLTPGVEMTTGPLGQGLGSAVGMALAERMLAARLGDDLVGHRTWVLASDGDMMEGVASEAASLAGHLGLGRLIVLYDDNGVTIDGPTRLAFSEDVGLRYEAYGWDVQRIDGHEPSEIRSALERTLQAEDRPHLVVCRTQIGRGSPAVDSSAAHGTIGKEATVQTRESLGWERAPFELPDQAGEAFRPNAEQGAKQRLDWQARLDQALLDPGRAALWRALQKQVLPKDLESLWPSFAGEEPMATRVASGRILNAIASAVPALVSGSADLAGSNATVIHSDASVERGKFSARNVCFGVREHAMAAIANGMALHGGVRPYIGTFLIFSDYMRPALRLAALMGQPVMYGFTHDSIFLGQDGPTHQPVEQLAALRAIPNLQVWRPADARETVAAWASALQRRAGPVAFALTRQAVPVLQAQDVEQRARRGGYVLVPEVGSSDPELIIVGTGSETQLAAAVATTLGAEGRRVRAVSLPCLEVFQAQDASYREAVLPAGSPRLLVEAGVIEGLACLLRAQDRFHGIEGFGASAAVGVLAERFRFTPKDLTRVARELLA